MAVMLIRDKQGAGDLVEDLSQIVYKQESGRFTKRMVHNALGWLQASHIVAYAGKSVDCDYLNICENARFYFLDVGVARYFLVRAGANEADINGIVAENFVYLTLLRRIPREIAGATPWFATYEKIKGGSNGGVAENGRMLTVPIFLADRVSFELGKKPG